MSVDVVIVAHNAGGLLAGSVRSAVSQADPSHVWVMDAASTDGSVDGIGRDFPNVNVVAVPNEGFSASNNRGIERGSAQWVLLLNPDAALMPGALETLLATAQADDSIAIVAPVVLNPDGSAQANSFGRFPTLVSQLRLRVWRAIQRMKGNSALSPKLPTRTAEVDWVTGAAMLVRRSAIEAVGPMDERFFLYYEDVEWCHRMHDGGWKVVVEPAARIVHHLGGSAAPGGVVARAYRESLDRYCDLYGLWGLKAVARAGRVVRSVMGGRG